MPDATPLPEPEYWVMHFDGSKLLNGSGAGVILQSPKGDKLHYVLQIHFKATNNMAEYEALIHGLRVASQGYWHQAHSLLWRFRLGCPAGGWHLECAEPYDGGISRRSGRDSQELL